MLYKKSIQTLLFCETNSCIISLFIMLMEKRNRDQQNCKSKIRHVYINRLEF